jgi:hypothetical protein
MSKRTRGEVRGLPESKPVVYYFLDSSTRYSVDLENDRAIL